MSILLSLTRMCLGSCVLCLVHLRTFQYFYPIDAHDYRGYGCQAAADEHERATADGRSRRVGSRVSVTPFAFELQHYWLLLSCRLPLRPCTQFPTVEPP